MAATSSQIEAGPNLSTYRRYLIILAFLVCTAFLMQANSSVFNFDGFIVSVLLVVVVALVLRHLFQRPTDRPWLAPLTILALVAVFVLSRFTRFEIFLFGTHGQWIGFTYLILRLIHTVVESKQVGNVAISDMTAYALFPPAIIAGPIHRAPQFLAQFASFPRRLSQYERIQSLERIGLGVIKKFVFASALSLFALDSSIVYNPSVSRGVLWVALLAYGFMLYFDFAGYSDIAIGVAGLIGIKLPENFANPYAQPDITRFWQSW